jgi:hypothetical protein
MVTGTAGPDRISIAPTELLGTVRVVFNGKVLGRFGPVTAIEVDAGAGNDTVTVGPRITLPTRLDGGAGNDHLQGGSGPNAILGGPGADTLVVSPSRDTYDGGTGRTHTGFLKSRGVIQTGPSLSGAGLRGLSGSYTLLPLQAAGPAVVGAADLRNAKTVTLLKNSYDGGQTVAIANATEANANALARLLGDPRPVDLATGVSRADLVAFRKITNGSQATFSVSVMLPVAKVATTPARRLAGTRAVRQGDRAYLAKVFTPTPSLGATAPVGDPGSDLINLANKYFDSKLYSDGQGDQAQLDDTVYSVRSFNNSEDFYYVTQEVQLTSVFGIIGQVGIGGHGARLNPTTPGLLGPPVVIQPGPSSTGNITQYTTSVGESFTGSIGWNQTSGFNASIGGGVSLSNSVTTVVPPVSIQYFPNLAAGTTNWLFVSNNGNLSQFTATDSWIWVVPFKDYSAGQTNLPFTAYTDVGPVTGATTYQVERTLAAPLPFGDTFQLQNPVVSGVSVPTVAPGGEFTITGSAFYPFLVEGVVIGGQGLSSSSFTALNDSQIEVVAPNTPGNALSVIVKTGQGLSNGNVTINIGSPSQVSVQTQPVAAVAGQALSNVTEATVTDSDTNANPADFAATINWGDGSTSSGTLTATGPGTFTVSGAHTYVTTGNFTFSVQVTDPSGNKASSTGTATVSAPNTGGGPQNLTSQQVAAVAGKPFVNVTLATFTDSDPGASPSDFSAGIDWGDGISTPITTVTEPQPGVFDVLGTHTYDVAGNYTYSVQVTDNSGHKLTTTGSASVAKS